MASPEMFTVCFVLFSIAQHSRVCVRQIKEDSIYRLDVSSSEDMQFTIDLSVNSTFYGERWESSLDLPPLQQLTEEELISALEKVSVEIVHRY